MKILVVASLNKGHYVPFVTEQCEALRSRGVEVEMFGIEGRGAAGYLRNLRSFRRAIMRFGPDVIHAHYGLSGLFANLQRTVPVVTTYHGSDINDSRALPFSRMAVLLSAHNIFVSRRIMSTAGVMTGRAKNRSSLIPCGVSLSELPVVERSQARRRMGLRESGRYVLFSGAYGNAVKNAPLAQEAIARLNEGVPDPASKVELVELRGWSREQVNLLMNGCDALLMTSFTEGSPQVVKEAMAVGCPVVSVDVGDVSELVQGLGGCRIAARTPEALSDALQQVFGLGCGFRTGGRERIVEAGLTNDVIIGKIMDIYEGFHS